MLQEKDARSFILYVVSERGVRGRLVCIYFTFASKLTFCECVIKS